jgi:phospholipid/cholesterol/gamma-HCH transport system substrate-binding protein
MSNDRSAAIKAGLFVILCGVLFSGIIIMLGERDQLFTAQYSIHACFHSAQGLMPGSDVRLAGVRAGSVGKVDLRKDGEGHYMAWVRLDVAHRYRGWITQKSRASIRTLGPLGDKYVEITLGSADETAIAPGRRIETDEGEDWYSLSRRARVAVDQINQVGAQVSAALSDFNQKKIFDDFSASIKSLRRMINEAEKGKGLLHELVYDKDLPKMLTDLRQTSASLRRSVEHVEKGEGPLGAMIHGKDLRAAILDIAASAKSVKSILAEVEKGKGVAHGLIYDEEQGKALAKYGDVAKRLDAILAAIEEGRGTLGLLIGDPEIWETIKRILGGVEDSRALKYIIQRKAAVD